MTAKADWLHGRQENIYAQYDAKLHHAQQLALQAKVNTASSIKSQKLDETPKYDVDPTCIRYDADGTCIYTIQHGDTLTHISKMFGYSVDRLANYNQIRDVNLIYTNSSHYAFHVINALYS